MRQDFMFIVGKGDARSRLDKLVLKYFPGDHPARTTVQSWIKNGLVLVDDVPCFKASQNLFPDQRVVVSARIDEADPKPQKGLLDEIYKDDHVLVLNKQAGISVHPAQSLDEHTLVNYLLEKYPRAMKKFSGDRPGIVHRLDRDTSGLMVVALDPQSKKNLARSFHDRKVVKEYLAIVHGCPEAEHGGINYPLGRDPKSRTKMAVVRDGRSAITRYQILHRGINKIWSLVRLEILTGRTHQIRVHMARLGHPVLGDHLYGGRIRPSMDFKQNSLAKLVKRQLLHSARLDFSHPSTGKMMSFTKPPPKDFIRSVLYLERKVQRVVITGAMGSGKSTVMTLLEKNGFAVFTADKCVAELYEPGNDGWRIIKSRFGNMFIDGIDQPVNKTKLFRAICEDKAILEELNHLIHPLVRYRLEEFWKKNRDKRVGFAEIPLVFETGMDNECDLVAGVFCPDITRYRRLAKKRNISQEQISVLDKSQMSQVSKLKRCSLVLDNSLHRPDLELKVKALARVLWYLRSRNAQKRFGFFKKLFEFDAQGQT